ncbi:MAG: nucleotidyltransferase family protein [Gammaproteobacteria bacterium]|nr:nucleotidyltransferase family protein [Gammaproteobacteria bacterium]MDH3468899.1 nucleotidyltransferase family protein [Gammaproteobacteria bacterium]
MVAIDAETALLRASARIVADADSLAAIACCAAEIQHWERVVVRAETHSIAPLLYHHICRAGVEIPPTNLVQLRALAVRHRHANEVRLRVLTEIIGRFGAAGIESIVLKGAALAHMIYPSPGLRPMRDIDVLVPGAAAGDAQRILVEIGFDAPSEHRVKTMRHHHHLPIASCVRDGLRVSIEVHHDAVSGDYPDRIRVERLASPLQSVATGAHEFNTFGHIDMLRHLCLHAFEPAAETRLAGVADIVGYAAHFVADIDWSEIVTEWPRITNTLTLLHYVTPLPDSLALFKPPPEHLAPEGIGHGIEPISHILGRKTSVRRLLKELLYPPEWWLRGYYAAPLTLSPMYLRWGKHAPRLGRWAARRLWASVYR